MTSRVVLTVIRHGATQANGLMRAPSYHIKSVKVEIDRKSVEECDAHENGLSELEAMF